ncbi:MAG: SIMPL domain-containing protein [Nitrosopumilaceae archaeon]
MNKTLIATLTAIVLVLAFAIILVPQEKQATAQEITPFPSREKIISVTGTATTSVEPDLLRVQFGVETQEKTAKAALEANSSQMTAIVEAIKKIGITEDDLSTSSLNIYPVYDSYQDKLTGRYTQELIGYRVSNILMVETSQLSLAADIIDSAVAAGANRVDSVYFTLSPEKQLEVNDDLISQAVLNAKSKAEKALAPLDHKIIGVKAVSLSEFGMPPPIPYYDASYNEGAALKASTPVFSSDQEVSTTANVIFVIGSN